MSVFSSIKEVNKNLQTIHLGDNSSESMLSEPGIRIFSSSEVFPRCDSDCSIRTNGESRNQKDDSETDRMKGLTESEVLSEQDMSVRKRRKRKKRRPCKEVDYQSESACELLDSNDVFDEMVIETETKVKKRKRTKSPSRMFQRKRRKLDTDSGGDGDVSSDTDTDVFSPPTSFS